MVKHRLRLGLVGSRHCPVDSLLVKKLIGCWLRIGLLRNH